MNDTLSTWQIITDLKELNQAIQSSRRILRWTTAGPWIFDSNYCEIRVTAGSSCRASTVVFIITLL